MLYIKYFVLNKKISAYCVRWRKLALLGVVQGEGKLLHRSVSRVEI